jgi:hypothetical protein
MQSDLLFVPGFSVGGDILWFLQKSAGVAKFCRDFCHRLIRLILSAEIFDDSVVGRIPSSSAAPSDP